MNSDDAKQRAQQLFKPNGSTPTPDYEARSREVRQKIEYLRSLRLAAQTRNKTSSTERSTD